MRRDGTVDQAQGAEQMREEGVACHQKAGAHQRRAPSFACTMKGLIGLHRTVDGAAQRLHGVGCRGPCPGQGRWARSWLTARARVALSFTIRAPRAWSMAA